MSQQFDVGVVGYGGCSAVLVSLLLERGLKVVVFDKEAGVLEIPRAAHFDDETVRTFQVLGVADELAESFSTSKDYGIYNALDQRVAGFATIEPEPTDQGWLSDYFFFQPEFEHYLRARALEQGATVKLRCEVVDLEERPEGVVITYKDASLPNDQQTQKVSARYVVGADGARSFVRKKIGIEMEQLAKSQRWMIVDIKVHDGVVQNLARDAWTKVTPEETITYVPMPKNMQRFEYSMKEGLTEADVRSPEAITAFIGRWFRPGDYDVLRADVYHFHSLVANDWQKGRIFLAGDAAHLNPPFLGQGICAGIRDAANLAWKLALVARGECSESLLDTYQSERRPHAYVLVKIAGDVGEQLQWMATATREELTAMQRRDYEHGKSRPILGPGLHPAWAKGGGRLGPQPRLAEGRLLDYEVGYEFALIGDPAVISSLSRGTTDSLQVLKAAVVADGSDTVRKALEPFGGSVILVRPDRYLIGAASSAAEVEALVRHVTESLQLRRPGMREDGKLPLSVR